MDSWLQIFFLLLPVAFVSGWLVARKSSKKIKLNQKININPNYLKGINYLLDEKQDKAIELFLSMLDVDTDTIELHLTLGHLFRRKGEVDKAIQLHQNILAKPELDTKQRARVVYELGCDFMSSGLLDRAEGLFNDLIEGKNLVQKSEINLLDIYEKEKEWEKAIDIGCRLAKYDTKKYYPRIAHYYCELLDEGLKTFTNAKMDITIQKAFAYDKKSVRARILEGDIFVKRGQYEKAIEVYLHIEKDDKALLPLVIKSVFYCIHNLDNKKYKEKLLKMFASDATCTSALIALTNYVHIQKNENDAKSLLLKRLTERPSLRVLNEWIKFELINSTDKNKKSIELIHKMLNDYLLQLSQFKCTQCGYKSNVVEWQCPTCKNWGVIKPVYGVSGE